MSGLPCVRACVCVCTCVSVQQAVIMFVFSKLNRTTGYKLVWSLIFTYMVVSCM